MSWQLGAFLVLAIALASGFAWYERSRPDSRVVALVATLAAFAALGRVAFAALPNVKPTTDIVLIAGYALGAGPGFVVGSLAALSSNFFFGQGPWTPWQMAGWGVTGLIGAWLAIAHRGMPRRRARAGVSEPRAIGRLPLALICAAVGFGFTALQDLGDWVTYSDHSSAQLGVYLGKGVGFDAVHAAGCALFALAFGPALARAIARFAVRMEITWRPPVSLVPVLVAVIAALALAPGLPARAASAGGQTSYLRSAQNRDGGFGPGPGQASAPLYAGWVALGFASAGISPSQVVRDGHSLSSYLLSTAAETRDAGSVERSILALRAAGIAVTHAGTVDLLARLGHAIRRNGSVSDQVNLTAFAILALRSAGALVPARMSRWLLRQADGDGGFGFATAGGSSDVDDTGAVLEALAGMQMPAAARTRRRAVAYIEAHQTASGGFPAQPGEEANAQSTAWAVQGLLAAHAPGSAVERGVGFLRSLIAGDGHVRYSRTEDQSPVWVTGEALMALERKPLPLAPVTATPPRAAQAKTLHRRAARAGARRGGRHPSAARRRVAAGGAPTLALTADVGALAALALAPMGLG